MIYKIQFVNGYPLINNGEHLFLVDLGMPLSFSPTGTITLCGEACHAATSILTFDMRVVHKAINDDVYGVVGADLLNRFVTRIDYSRGEIEMGCTEHNFGDNGTSFSLAGYYGAEFTVDGVQRRLFVDTGAPISYLGKRLFDGLQPSSTVQDISFLDSGASFATPLYNLPVEFMGQQWDMNFGELPPIYAITLQSFQVDGVIGGDMLKRFCVTVGNGMLYFRPSNTATE